MSCSFALEKQSRKRKTDKQQSSQSITAITRKAKTKLAVASSRRKPARFTTQGLSRMEQEPSPYARLRGGVREANIEIQNNQSSHREPCS